MEKVELGVMYSFEGHCTGVLPSGTEISQMSYSEYNTVNNGRLNSGKRLLKGNTYLLHGKPVMCVQSGFSNGSAYYPGSWSFTLGEVVK